MFAGQPSFFDSDELFDPPDRTAENNSISFPIVEAAHGVMTDLNDYEARVTQKEAQFVDLTNYSKPKGCRDCRPGHKKILLSAEDCEAMEIRLLGKKFAYQVLLWLRDPTTTFLKQVDLDYRAENRFSDIIEGQRYELFAHIPEKLYGKITNPAFQSYFMRGLAQQRADGAHRVRSCRTDIFKENKIDFNNSDAIKELNGWRPKSLTEGSYHWMAPILYVDYAGKADKTKMFLNPALFRVYKAIFNGQSSVQDRQAKTNSSGQRPVGIKWCIKEVTPGAIVASAIYARYLLTDDSAFQSVGDNSQINYQDFFEKYLELLTTGLDKKDRSIVKLFDIWNTQLYPNSKVANIAADDSDAAEMEDIFDSISSDDDYDGHAQRNDGMVSFDTLMLRNAKREARAVEAEARAVETRAAAAKVAEAEVRAAEAEARVAEAEARIAETEARAAETEARAAETEVRAARHPSVSSLENPVSCIRTTQANDYEEVDISEPSTNHLNRYPSQSQIAQSENHSGTAHAAGSAEVAYPRQAIQSETSAGETLLQSMPDPINSTVSTMASGSAIVAVLQDFSANIPSSNTKNTKRNRVTSATTVRQQPPRKSARNAGKANK